MTLDDRRFDHHKLHALTTPERQARWDPPRFLSRFAIRPGEAVLDLGAGPGFWTFPLADMVGDKGTVWALDVSKDMLDAIAKRNPPGQVRLLQAELPGINLPDSIIDWIWAAFVFHEVAPPEKMAGEMSRLIKDKGVVAVLDWRPDKASEGGPPPQYRLSGAQVIKYLHDAGFGSVEQTWQDEDAYLIQAQK